METYLDKNGSLLPKFYQDPKWKVMGSILLTVIDCTCWIATWGFAIYLVFLKSIFVIACSLLFPSPPPKEKEVKEKRISIDARRSGKLDIVDTPNRKGIERSRPPKPNSEDAAVSTSENIISFSPEMESEASQTSITESPSSD